MLKKPRILWIHSNPDTLVLTLLLPDGGKIRFCRLEAPSQNELAASAKRYGKAASVRGEGDPLIADVAAMRPMPLDARPPLLQHRGALVISTNGGPL
jgi:hypothetical protein